LEGAIECEMVVDVTDCRGRRKKGKAETGFKRTTRRHSRKRDYLSDTARVRLEGDED